MEQGAGIADQANLAAHSPPISSILWAIAHAFAAGSSVSPTKALMLETLTKRRLPIVTVSNSPLLISS
jgi:hypothetical protein